MRAAVFTGAGSLQVTDLPDPVCADREVIVRVAACGICGTDRAIFRGEAPARTPVVLGHEYSGTVVETGRDVDDLAVGDRVAIDPNVIDGTCFFCRRGETHLCSGLAPLGIVRNGGFAEYSAVPATNAYRLPDTISLEAGSLVEPLACCVHGADQADVRLGDTVVVLGAGPIGCLLIQMARLRGAAEILAVEPDRERREHARAAGADVTCEPDEVIDRLQRLRGSIGADVVIEATGVTTSAEIAVDLVRRGGTVLLFGVYPELQRMSVRPLRVNEDELRIVGSLNNPSTHQRAIDLLASGQITVQGTITHRIDLSQLESAMLRESFPGAGKLTVDPAPSGSPVANRDGSPPC